MKTLFNDYMALARANRNLLIYAALGVAFWLGMLAQKKLPNNMLSAGMLCILLFIPAMAVLGILAFTALFILKCTVILITGRRDLRLK